MGRWERRRLRLKKNHGWKSERGCKIFVADRGAVRLDFPEDWVVVPDAKGSIKFLDRKPPNDDCTMQLTVMYLRDDVDWTGLDLSAMVRDVTTNDSREILERGDVQASERDGMDMAWIEVRFRDPNEDREAFSRTLLARKWNIQPLITFDFWADDIDRVGRAWDIMMKTLTLGDYVEDPTQRV